MQAVEAQLIFDDPNTETDVARLVLYNVSSATTWCSVIVLYLHTLYCAALTPLILCPAQIKRVPVRLLLRLSHMTEMMTICRFTDKPIRRAGAFETSYFSSSETFDEEGTWLGAPNAALTGTYQNKPYVVIVTLFAPKYDNVTNTLQYTVRTCHF